MSAAERQVFSALYAGGQRARAVAEVARALYMHRDTVDQHLLALERRHLIVTSREGRARLCRVAPWVWA